MLPCRIRCKSNNSKNVVYRIYRKVCLSRKKGTYMPRFLSYSGSLLLSLLLFIALNLIPDCPILLLNLTGIIFSVSLCLNLTPIVSGLFSSFRDYTFQIFLLGIFPQIAIRILYSKIPQNELSYWSLYIISILLGIYLPVFIAKIVEKIPNKLIRRCFGL